MTTQQNRNRRRNALWVPCAEQLEPRLVLSAGLDPTFGAGGKVTIPISLSGANDSSATAVAALPDGQILVGGYEGSSPDSNSTPISSSGVVVRLNPNGSVDTSFGQNGFAILPSPASGANLNLIEGMAVEANGDIMVVETSQFSSLVVAKLTPSGALDTSFGQGGQVRIPVKVGGDNQATASGITVQPDGKIVAFGTSQNSLSVSWASVVRLDADGSLDSTFGQGGVSLVNFGYHGSQVNQSAGGAIQPDGKIVVFGSSGPQPFGTAMAAARLNADGSLDSSFGSGGISTVGGNRRGNLAALGGTLQSDGKIVVTGTEYAGRGNDPFAAVRFNSDGTIDRSFHKTGVATANFHRGGFNGDEAHGVVETASGNLVLGGMTWPKPPKYADFGAAELTPAGALDTRFAKKGLLVIPFNLGGNKDDEAFAATLEPNGEVLLVGYATVARNTTDMAVARLMA